MRLKPAERIQLMTIGMIIGAAFFAFVLDTPMEVKRQSVEDLKLKVERLRRTISICISADDYWLARHFQEKLRFTKIQLTVSQQITP